MRYTFELGHFLSCFARVINSSSPEAGIVDLPDEPFDEGTTDRENEADSDSD
jgi:hypothetical protein